MFLHDSIILFTISCFKDERDPCQWVPVIRFGLKSQTAEMTVSLLLLVQSEENLPANAEDSGSIPGSGRSPGEGNGNPLQYSCLGIPRTEEPGGLQSMDRKSWTQRLNHHSLCAKSLQSCPTLCDAMDHSTPGSSVHGILQARILEWVAMPSSRGSSWPRHWTHVSYISCTAVVSTWYNLDKFRRRQWHPTPVLLPGKSHGRRSLVGCSPRGC